MTYQLMPGVIVTPLRRIKTEKGDVLHAMKASDYGYCGFGEVYFSEILPGERKGWKRHNRMTLNIVVVKGAVRFIVYDNRPNSSTKGEFREMVLSPDGVAADDLNNWDGCTMLYARLTVEPGLWMAFEGIDNNVSMLMDVIPELHDPLEADRLDLNEIQYL